MEAVGNSGGGQFEGFRGGVQGEKNGRHRDDHRWDIVIVCSYCLPPFPSPPWVVESSKNRLCGYKYCGGSAHNYHRPWIQVPEGQVQWCITEQAQFWGWIRNSPGRRCGWERSMNHWFSGQWCHLFKRSSRKKCNTRTSRTVGRRWSWMTLFCSNLSWPLSYSILR